LKITLVSLVKLTLLKKQSILNFAAELLSKITRAINEDEYVRVVSLDLNLPLDTVGIRLLLKRLNIISLPSDIIELIKIWLENRSYYASTDGVNSVLF
jgi:hypothetical protein